MRLFARQHRRLRQLDARLALERARARDARRQVGSSARRRLARPAMLIAPFTAGALVALAVSRPKKTIVRSSTQAQVKRTGLTALAATALRLWSRTAMVRNLLKPVVRSVVNAPPQTVIKSAPGQDAGRAAGTATHPANRSR